MTGVYFKDKIEYIKMKMVSGIITYDQAKKEAQPIINQMNLIGRDIARKYGRRFYAFDFITLMR